jgi:hypothetical protein
MLAGKPYHYSDPYIQLKARRGMQMVRERNAEKDGDKRTALLKDFFTTTEAADFYVALPFFCEDVTGSGGSSARRPVLTTLARLLLFNQGHITLGDSMYIAPNCTFLDVAPSRSRKAGSSSLSLPAHFRVTTRTFAVTIGSRT